MFQSADSVSELEEVLKNNLDSVASIIYIYKDGVCVCVCVCVCACVHGVCVYCTWVPGNVDLCKVSRELGHSEHSSVLTKLPL